MLLQKFLNLIDNTSIGRAISHREELIDQLDPERFYVENIRSFFGLPHSVARLLCDMAVREGLFLRRFGVMCPQCDRIIQSVKSESDIPIVLACDVCERNESERYEFKRDECRTIVYYKLND
jgi:hypothetical protein